MGHEHIKKMIKHNPHRVFEILEEMSEFFGDEVYEFFDNHIKTKECYDEAVACFRNFDGTSGGHWSVEAIQQRSNIDFDHKEYTIYDFAYIVNMRYSDDGDLLTVDNVFKSAQRYLEDADFYGNPSERAYYDAKKRKEYFKS